MYRLFVFTAVLALLALGTARAQESVAPHLRDPAAPITAPAPQVAALPPLTAPVKVVEVEAEVGRTVCEKVKLSGLANRGPQSVLHAQPVRQSASAAGRRAGRIHANSASPSCAVTRRTWSAGSATSISPAIARSRINRRNSAYRRVHAAHAATARRALLPQAEDE